MVEEMNFKIVDIEYKGIENCKYIRKSGTPCIFSLPNMASSNDYRRFSKLTKFSANCHIVNDWSCFIEHRL